MHQVTNMNRTKIDWVPINETYDGRMESMVAWAHTEIVGGYAEGNLIDSLHLESMWTTIGTDILVHVVDPNLLGLRWLLYSLPARLIIRGKQSTFISIAYSSTNYQVQSGQDSGNLMMLARKYFINNIAEFIEFKLFENIIMCQCNFVSKKRKTEPN